MAEMGLPRTDNATHGMGAVTFLATTLAAALDELLLAKGDGAQSWLARFRADTIRHLKDAGAEDGVAEAAADYGIAAVNAVFDAAASKFDQSGNFNRGP